MEHFCFGKPKRDGTGPLPARLRMSLEHSAGPTTHENTLFGWSGGGRGPVPLPRERTNKCNAQKIGPLACWSRGKGANCEPVIGSGGY